MKHLILILSILSIALNARAQINPQPDSVPPAQGWVQLTSGTTAGFNFISLVGRDTVYVSGDRILRSIDAGATWQQLLQMPLIGGRLQFIDDTTAFLSGNSDTVYKTTNGGMTWNANYTGLLPGLTAIFGSKNNGIASSNDVYYTSDGGASWHPSSGNSGGQYNCWIFADTVHAYAMGSSSYWNNGNMPWAPTFERSSDGGATWQPIYPGPSQDVQGHPHSGIAKDVWGITALNVDTLIAVGDQIGRSTDGGSDWDTLTDPTSVEHFHGACFADNLRGTIVGSNGIIVHTTNAGLTWIFQYSGITDGSYLYDVKFVDTLTAYAVGDNGIILKTTNAGLSWVQLSPGLDSIQITEYPNPANSQMLISYTLPEAQHVTLTILDLTGNVVSQILDRVLQSGQQSVLVDLSRFPCGTYFAELCSEKYFSVVKFEKLCS